jgi:endonuclease-3
MKMTATSVPAADPRQILEILSRVYPDIRTLLRHRNAFELLIAAVLSARTTDNGVNRVTPELFRRFPDSYRLAAAPEKELEELVHSLGYFRAKARAVKAAAKKLIAEYGGRVPAGMEELLSLPGVGRKTANVVLSQVFGKPAIIVDTHFGRVVRRLGLTVETDPGRVETALIKIVPEEERSAFSMRINLHGRRICTARRPACFRCVLRELCPYEPKTSV